jgi:hypothetical protein
MHRRIGKLSQGCLGAQVRTSKPLATWNGDCRETTFQSHNTKHRAESPRKPVTEAPCLSGYLSWPVSAFWP